VSATTETLPRLALSPPEAAKALGVSETYFLEHISGDLHWVRRGRKRLVAVEELQRWLAANGERVLG
jgi:excisionase family DNA binding protein